MAKKNIAIFGTCNAIFEIMMTLSYYVITVLKCIRFVISFCNVKKNIQFVNQNLYFFICMHHPISGNFSCRILLWIEEIAQHFSRAGIKNVSSADKDNATETFYVFSNVQKLLGELLETKTMKKKGIWRTEIYKSSKGYQNSLHLEVPKKLKSGMMKTKSGTFLKIFQCQKQSHVLDTVLLQPKLNFL